MGAQKPRLPQNTYSSHTEVINGKEIQCKMTSGVIDPETNVDYGMVADGTICGNEMVILIDGIVH